MITTLGPSPGTVLYCTQLPTSTSEIDDSAFFLLLFFAFFLFSFALLYFFFFHTTNFVSFSSLQGARIDVGLAGDEFFLFRLVFLPRTVGAQVHCRTAIFACPAIDKDAMLILGTFGAQMAHFITDETMAIGKIRSFISFGTFAEGMFCGPTLVTDSRGIMFLLFLGISIWTVGHRVTFLSALKANQIARIQPSSSFPLTVPR